MPIFPTVPKIAGYDGAFPYIATIGGLGGIAHNLAKFAQKPADFFEADGYEERDGEQGEEVIRTFVGPWSQRLAFKAWALGYSYRQIKNTGLAQAIIRRVIPAQDPQRPHLFACAAQILTQSSGAWVIDPNNQPLAANGTPVAGQIDCTAFIDNVEQGSIGSVTVPPADAPPGFAPVITNPSGKFSDGSCRIRVTYRPRADDILDDTTVDTIPYVNGTSTIGGPVTGPGEMARYVERRYLPSIEALPLSRVNSTNGLQFIPGPGVAGGPTYAPAPYAGNAIFEAGVIQIMSLQVEWRIRDMPDAPLQRLMSMMGKVNRYGFDGPYYNLPGYIGFDPGILLFQQPSWTGKYRSRTGNVVWREVVVRGVARAVNGGWNAGPASDGNFYPIGWAVPLGGGSTAYNPVYQSVDAWPAIWAPSPIIQWLG